MPPAQVWTFTANVNCLSCDSGLLASWRAEEKLHLGVAATFHDFRRLHMSHEGFCEGLPAHGWRAEADALPSGVTALSRVGVSVDPDDCANLRFYHFDRPHYYRSKS